MRHKILSKFFTIFLTFSLLTIVFSCSEREQTVDCFPKTGISVQLDLKLPAYQKLQYTGGWIYVNEQGSGTRGLIVVRTSNGFKVYDRNAPHICPGANTTLEVSEDIKITCKADNSEWILLTGQPTKVAKIAPKTYFTNYDSGSQILAIYN